MIYITSNDILGVFRSGEKHYRCNNCTNNTQSWFCRHIVTLCSFHVLLNVYKAYMSLDLSGSMLCFYIHNIFSAFREAQHMPQIDILVFVRLLF